VAQAISNVVELGKTSENRRRKDNAASDLSSDVSVELGRLINDYLIARTIFAIEYHV